MLEYRIRVVYERERVHAECEERNLLNETSCKSYAYRKKTILKSMLINSILKSMLINIMPGCGWGFSDSYDKQCLSVMRTVSKIRFLEIEKYLDLSSSY
jgi:hypothetical protein